MNASKLVFVTVGTTLFDELIQALDQEDVYDVLFSQGYTDILFQIGRGLYEPKGTSLLRKSFYRFNPEYKQDIEKASLVISHAGAGSIMDALMQQKPLLVVPNENLMDNHQVELADALAERKHLYHAKCKDIKQVLANVDFDALVPYPIIDDSAFPNFIDSIM